MALCPDAGSTPARSTTKDAMFCYSECCVFVFRGTVSANRYSTPSGLNKTSAFPFIQFASAPHSGAIAGSWHFVEVPQFSNAHLWKDGWSNNALTDLNGLEALDSIGGSFGKSRRDGV